LRGNRLARFGGEGHNPGESPARGWLCCALIAGAALAVYGNTLGNEFVFDDKSSIVGNSVVRDLDVRAIFTTPSWWGRHMLENGYRPLVTLSFALNHAAGGFNPVGYHLVNILLHALVSIAVYSLVRRLGGREGLALVSGLLFAVHPLNSEAVAWATGRAELMSALFVLLAVHTDIRSYGDDGWSRAATAGASVVACFVCGLLSKENAVTLLPALVVTDFAVRCRGSWRALVSGLAGRRGGLYLALLLSLAVYIVWRLDVQSGTRPMMNAAMNPLRAEGLPVRWLNALVIGGRYLWLWVAPLRLSVDYMFDVLPVIRTVWDWRVGASTAALGACAALGLWGWRRGALPVAWGVLFGACTYSVVSNVAMPIQAMMAERWMYLPSAGLSVVTVCAAGEMWGRGHTARWARPATALAVAVLLLFGARTFARNRDWHDAVALWTSTLAATPRSLKAREGLGEAHFYAHEYPEAEQQLSAALEIYRDPRTLALLGASYAHEDKLDAAQAAFAEALARWPGSRDANWGLGSIALRRMQLQQAVAYLEQARALDPDAADLRVQLGQAYYLSGRGDAGKTEFLRALQLDPKDGAAHTGLAACAQIAGDYSTAVREYLEALRLGEKPTPQLGGQLRVALQAYAVSHPDAARYAREALGYFADDAAIKRLAASS